MQFLTQTLSSLLLLPVLITIIAVIMYPTAYEKKRRAIESEKRSKLQHFFFPQLKWHKREREMKPSIIKRFQVSFRDVLLSSSKSPCRLLFFLIPSSNNKHCAVLKKFLSHHSSCLPDKRISNVQFSPFTQSCHRHHDFI